MRSSKHLSGERLHHLSDEMALALPPRLGFHWPRKEIRRIVAEQTVLALPYRDFAGAEHLGQLVVHRTVADATQAIFEALFTAGFPIQSMTPISAFRWSDERSMAANNCVGFHFRNKTGKDELSWHAYGRAIDINPLQNPYVKDKTVLPPRATYGADCPGTCTPDSLPVQLFRAHGFAWGGEWTSLKDYMHFEFPFSV